LNISITPVIGKAIDYSASPNYLLTILLIQVVQSIKEVTLESIATKLAIPIKFESRRKKVQRFLSEDIAKPFDL
jgi:hypothetical protein